MQLLSDDCLVLSLFARLLGDQSVREPCGRRAHRAAAPALHGKANAASIAALEHSLKTPLTVIRSAVSQLIQDSGLNDGERELLLDALDRQSSTLEVTVHDLPVQS